MGFGGHSMVAFFLKSLAKTGSGVFFFLFSYTEHEELDGGKHWYYDKKRKASLAFERSRKGEMIGHILVVGLKMKAEKYK